MIQLTERADARLLRLRHLCDDAVALANSTVGRIAALRRTLNNDPPNASSIESELIRLHSSPTPGEQKAAADLWLQNLPAHSRPRIKANKHEQFAVEFSDPTSHTVRLPIASILYWLFPDELRARLHAEVDSLPTPALVLSAEKKAERVAEVRGLMLEAERQEAALIEFGEQEGQRLVFRPFISPLALLSLALRDKESQRAA